MENFNRRRQWKWNSDILLLNFYEDRRRRKKIRKSTESMQSALLFIQDRIQKQRIDKLLHSLRPNSNAIQKERFTSTQSIHVYMYVHFYICLQFVQCTAVLVLRFVVSLLSFTPFTVWMKRKKFTDLIYRWQTIY